MELKIITDAENPLFNRREIEGEIHAEITPSREDVRKIISEKFSTEQDNIKIRTIKGKFGQKVFLIVANIYKSKEDKDKIELKKKKDTEAEKRQAESAQKTAEPVEEKTDIQESEKEVSKEAEEIKLEETNNGEKNV